MQTASDVRDSVHTRLLAVRNTFSLISSEKFVKVFESATAEQRRRINELVDKSDSVELGKLVRRLSMDSLETMPVRELRRLAQQYGIEQYNTMPKALLLSAIASTEDARKTREDDLPPTQGQAIVEDSDLTAEQVDSLGRSNKGTLRIYAG